MVRGLQLLLEQFISAVFRAVRSTIPREVVLLGVYWWYYHDSFSNELKGVES